MNNNRKNDNSDLGFWIVMVVLFVVGAWPIAVPAILFKLFGRDKKEAERRSAPPLNPGVTAANRTNVNSYRTVSNTDNWQTYKQPAKPRTAAENIMRTPKPDRKNQTLLFVCGVLMFLLGSLILMGQTAFSFTVMSAIGLLLGGASMVAGGFSLAKAGRRYSQYMNIIGTTQAVEIKALAKKTGQKESRVLKDLERMIDKGYFGDTAYINVELGYLFLSSKADAEVSKYREAAEKKQKEAQSAKAQSDLAEGYNKIIAQIRDVNDRIAHPVMSEKIYRIEDITRQIFSAVQADPQKRSMINTFLSYYLPTTLKLLESYAQLEKTGAESDNIIQSKQSIENAMDSIVSGFERQLDDLYKADVMDIESDIDVMTKMMHQSNPSEDFKITVDESVPGAGEPGKTQFEKDFGLKHQDGGFVSLGGAAAQQTAEEKK